MNTLVATLLCTAALGGAVAAIAGQPAAAGSPISQAIVRAIRKGDCDTAIRLANDNVPSGDARVDFVAGRMAEEGICVRRDSALASSYFARGSQLGSREAALEYGARIGLGQGTGQSYEHAGDVCHGAGLDPGDAATRYSLGYACTVSQLAAELVREQIPPGAFAARSPVARIEFTPASGTLTIRSLPAVTLADATTGSWLRHPVIDARVELERAWQSAVDSVPKPDPSRLDSRPIELALDLDTTLEAGLPLAPEPGHGALLKGELLPASVLQQH